MSEEEQKQCSWRLEEQKRRRLIAC